jgi:hypothetical protein
MLQRCHVVAGRPCGYNVAPPVGVVTLLAAAEEL